MRPVRPPGVARNVTREAGRRAKLERRYIEGEVWRDIIVYATRGALAGTLADSSIVVAVGDGQTWFEVSEEEDGFVLIAARAGVSAAGAVTVQLRNATQAVDLLTTPITIDAGGLSWRTAATPPVIDDTIVLAAGDQVFVDIDAADGDAEGLNLTIGTGPA